MEAKNQPSQPCLEQIQGQQPQPRERKKRQATSVSSLGFPFPPTKRRRLREEKDRPPEAGRNRSKSRSPACRLPTTSASGSETSSHPGTPTGSGEEEPSRQGSPELGESSSLKPKDFSVLKKHKLRSITPCYPKAPPTNPSYQFTLKYFSDERKRALRAQRSKLHRRNLRAQRDFPHTLETLSSFAGVAEDSSDTEYNPSIRADSIPTSGQSTPESLPEPISNEELFGFRARPVSPVPATPPTPRSP